MSKTMGNSYEFELFGTKKGEKESAMRSESYNILYDSVLDYYICII
jgi:hypothetical protein